MRATRTLLNAVDYNTTKNLAQRARGRAKLFLFLLFYYFIILLIDSILHLRS
jgi:hypothetical protein